MSGDTSAGNTGARNKRTNFLVLPGFQIRFMMYIIGFAFFGILALYASSHLYFDRLISEGRQLGLSPDHIYFEFVDQQRSVLNQTFMVVAALVFGGMILIGLVLSHKIAGPIYRIQVYLQEVREKGVASRRLSFRDGDFFPEVAELIEELTERARRGEHVIKEQGED